jgi:hypothetical protein
MSYFSFLPTVQYQLSSGSLVLAKDILTRAKIVDALKDLMGTYADYTITDDERPEHIAYRVYGRADYHWLILMYNEIHDPYFSWPMSTSELERFIDKSYPGKTLFINTGGLVENGKAAIFNNTIGVPHDRRRPHFEVGSSIKQVSGNSTVASATVYDWDSNLWKIVVDDVDGVFRLQGDAARVQPNGELFPVPNPLSLPKDIISTNSDGHDISASLLRYVEETKYSLHHFENESGEVVSPWHTPIRSASPLIERYVVGRQEVISVLDSLPPDPSKYGEEGTRTYTLVTNVEYEDRKNESKRKIKVMRPEYVDTVLRQLSRIMA